MTTRRRKRPGTATAPKVEASGDDPTVTIQASGEDAEAVAKSRQEANDKASRFTRPGASGKDWRDVRPGIAWGNVVNDTIKIDDPAKLTKRLRDELSLGDGVTDYGRVLSAMDKSARNFDDAGRLSRAAKIEDQRFSLECDERFEVMGSAALTELNGEYRAKLRPSPTAKHIEDRILQSWPDEYRTLKSRMSELHGAVRSLETLRDAWASRCADLRIMADKARPVR